jgi:dTDP-glucose 4,6-dehydratase
MIGTQDKILVTGGAGFIAAHFIRARLEVGLESIISVDKRTYAAAMDPTGSHGGGFHQAVRGDIGDRALMGALLREHRPMSVVNFAAETHVDRSILFPSDFLQANVVGAFNLLEEVREYWKSLPDADKGRFRFLQVSTDEVYGSLPPDASPCREDAPFAPNSPYAASKAAADHLVRVYFVTYGLPTTVARCCNNYGAYQYPEKLIPLMILRAIAGETLPIYGDGNQVRDWLYVGDHCAALNRILEVGNAGEVYNISAQAEHTNLEVVRKLCGLLDEIHPRKCGSYADLITHVADRPGHDRRYALNSAKIRRELGWRPKETFESGLEKTVRWYRDNLAWMRSLTGLEPYTDWLALNYGQRRVL